MKPILDIDAKFRPLVKAVLDFVQDFLRADPAHTEGSALYTLALNRLIESLLERFYPPGVPVAASARQLDLFDFMLPEVSSGDWAACASSDKGLEGVTPQEVGQLYELLRGFTLEVRSARQPSLVPCARGRRNYGLFYTPQAIVEHIVSRTLEALDFAAAADYLNLKILDPAVGTGVFLAQALEEISARVLSRARGKSPLRSPRMRELQEAVFEQARKLGMKIELAPDEALRIFIMSRCLYGVDVDPIAVRIAQVVLMERAFRNRPLIPGFEPNIRIGNSLMGGAAGDSSSVSRSDLDREYAAAYFRGGPPDTPVLDQWCREKRIFHWPLEFPEVFARNPRGFDAVIGNPPYEILSVKESGIVGRRGEQAYFRRVFRTCQGKINTYRLMLERGLALLRNSGTLGFIVPATLLADSTAEKLRRMILDETTLLEAVVVPERAQVFKGVTQAFLILVTRKTGRTESLRPVLWNGEGAIPNQGKVEISRSTIEKTGFRIPIIRSWEENALLDALTRHPRFRGDAQCPRIGRVHQGEINLTVHREFITAQQTAHPLIRGEHVTPLHLVHPIPGGHRLDWVLPEYLLSYENQTRCSSSQNCVEEAKIDSSSRGKPWETERVAVGRVVNMDTERRLKAAPAPVGAFLGDMTNSITELTVPMNYVLGLLNSTILNWRIKLTSTNNYLSAAEIEALPIPRVAKGRVSMDGVLLAQKALRGLLVGETHSIAGCVKLVHESLETLGKDDSSSVLARVIQSVVDEIRRKGRTGTGSDGMSRGLWNLLDAVVLMAYGADSYASVIDGRVE